MTNGLKQVYATLKFDDNKLQIIVAEYSNTRFNIIATYNNPIEGIVDFKIVDKDLVVDYLKKGIESISKKIGAKLEKVILIVPPVNFKKTYLTVSTVPEDGTLKKSDIARLTTNALQANVDDDLVVVNTLISKYTINGISTRRLLENESCDEAFLDIDLLCADKDVVYSYVDVVLKAGVEVLDIVLNNYAIAKESVLLDNSINKKIILLDIGNEVTYLSLLYKGRLMSSEIIHDGLANMENKLYEKYHLPLTAIPRLIKYNVDFNSAYPNDAIYAWNKDDKTYSLTIKELSDFIEEPLDEYLDKILMMCKPLLEKGADIWICGEGSNMLALVKKLRSLSGQEVQTYYPDTIGARNSELCAVYGALYVYREKANLNNLDVNCLNPLEYEEVVSKVEEDEESESITSKIRNLFEMYRDKGDIE